YELSERISRDPQTADIKLVLIGAIFRIDRFRRDPSNLYGAHDYIEEIITKHDLQNRVRRLLGIEASESAIADPIENARRLSRIILSDIIIYNQEQADEAIVHNRFYHELEGEIEEGRRYLLEKVTADPRQLEIIYKRTIEDYVNRRRQELLSQSPTNSV